MTTSRSSTTTYTIERIRWIDDIDTELAHFLFESAGDVSAQFGGKFDHRNFDFLKYARNGLFLICRKKGKPVGGLLARLYPALWDPKSIILMQDLLYVRPDGGRAAHLLMSAFIDFGKVNANHVFTMRTEKTNIKHGSLEKLGFKKIEEIYRLEV